MKMKNFKEFCSEEEFDLVIESLQVSIKSYSHGYKIIAFAVQGSVYDDEKGSELGIHHWHVAPLILPDLEAYSCYCNLFVSFTKC